jgi:hypothetical protein
MWPADIRVEWPRDDSVIKLLFLGIDGVLHPGSLRIDAPGRFSCLSRLESVLREFSDVQIVITGSWCHRHSLEELRAIFSPDIGSQVISVVPGSGRRQRQRRIGAYLELHALKEVAWMAVDRWSESVGDWYLWCIEGFQEGEECVLRVFLAGGRA